MLKKVVTMIVGALWVLLPLASYGLKPAGADPGAHPPRIIRTCCMFGTRVGVFGIPFLKLSAVTSLDKMGSHRFLGGSSENNGVVYTRKGGFIDMGHLRDNADWAAWLYALLLVHRDDSLMEVELGYEGGEKRLQVVLPREAGDEDLLLLAGRMAYDLAVWHEIATWYGVSSVPLVSEQYSSFSVEDTYSNLLGILLGMEAIRSELPYEEAMTALVAAKLQDLGGVLTTEETVAAMESVRDIWWTRVKRYPSAKVVMLRNVQPYHPVFPILTGYDQPAPESLPPLLLPTLTTQGDTLTGYYTLSVSVNRKFPVRRLFPGRTITQVTQKDFPLFIADINAEYATGFLVPRRLRQLGVENATAGHRDKKHQRQPKIPHHENPKG